MEKLHYSVLLEETIKSLNLQPDGIYVDLTLGMGGHSAKILEKLNKNGMLIAFDKDDYALEISQRRLSSISDKFILIKSDYSQLKSQLANHNIYKVDGIIADLGISSPQIDNANRGFSYNKDAKLDMRMDTSQELDAEIVVNTYSVEHLRDIFLKYADVKHASQVAKAIEKNRPIVSTMQLVEVIKSAYPAALLRAKNPAKAVFQALRIEVNNELYSLKTMLDDAVSLLKTNASLSIITFHSIEDRLVKHKFASLTASKIPAKMPIADKKTFLSKQVKPSSNEIQENKRSRSAKLRILTKILD
ncbi:16S rRNA (cytosine(1402)-N(4))-methyltransferase RsmH [Mycoplasmopsis alligatoris]|uniref:Ribosomal RNA small subunit methyltransferase H n=1 Tax=Mycoplasmopsis alligatoris A21JP2 TaxID=747682 RepID=D4XUX8_9BACT|nr:16S rRNA (cytosine(1402)-N(4))-methyltransferase RsmH [Mycoplasmopsis alligatoris]EFF41844.1 S-adenosyl-methyltransferase MraW [Mycoplasmopsis alligatoris A21JP2]